MTARAQTVAMLVIVLAAGAAGCLERDVLSPPDAYYTHATYEVTLAFDETVDVVRVTLGNISAYEEVTYPDGLRRAAWVRDFEMRAITNGSLAGEMARTHGYCEPGETSCTYAVAINPETGVPFRFYNLPYPDEPLPPLQEGSGQSRFISERNALGLLHVAPLFVGLAWAKDGVDDLPGGDFEAAAKARNGGTRVTFDGQEILHDPTTGENATLRMKGHVDLGRVMDPESAAMTYQEDDGSDVRVDYRYELVARGPIEVLPTLATDSTDAASFTTRDCGDDLNEPLFANSSYPYAEAFAVVQADPGFTSAKRNHGAMLTRIQGPEIDNSGAMAMRRWTFTIQSGQEATDYVVEASVFFADAPVIGGYELVAKQPADPHPTATELMGMKCIPIDQIQHIVDAYIDRIGADGYAQAVVMFFPAELAFRLEGAEVVPLAYAYSVNVRPFIYAENGDQLVGPRMTFSLITGHLLSIG